MKSLFFLLLLPTVAHCWTTKTLSQFGYLAPALLPAPLQQSAFSDELDNVPVSSELLTENPCWQDIYDDDCSMSSVYSAHFVAGKWIKSMPCAAGIEDCDMPPALGLPGPHQNAGVDQVDVMDFLGLKRAPAVSLETKADD